MALRGLLVGLIIAATAAFVVGVAIERSDEAAHHDEAAEVARVSGEAGATGEANSEAREAGEAAHAGGESVAASGESSEETETELRPLGIDIEAWPFVTLAALASLGLAAAAWLGPRLAPLLALVAATMLAFAALDARELFHQLDSDEGTLAVLAGLVAALHAAAALIAAAMSSRARRPDAGAPGSAGTMPA